VRYQPDQSPLAPLALTQNATWPAGNLMLDAQFRTYALLDGALLLGRLVWFQYSIFVTEVPSAGAIKRVVTMLFADLVNLTDFKVGLVVSIRPETLTGTLLPVVVQSPN